MNKIKKAFTHLGIRRGDVLLAAALLIISSLAGMIIFIYRPAPEYASIRVEGTEIARLPLEKDCIFQVGDGNTIQISEGTVRMIHADCPDKICVKTGKISHSGQSIVCAPHKVVITIIGGDSHSDIDVITN